MADVAAAAGISQGLAYRYFNSKDDVIYTLIDEAVQEGRASVQQLLESDAPPAARLERLIAGIVHSRQDRPALFQFLRRMDADGAPEAIRAVVREQGELFVRALKELIIQGQVVGEILEGDPGQLVIAIVACLDGLANWASAAPQRVNSHFPDASVILRLALRPPLFLDSPSAPYRSQSAKGNRHVRP
jgi:AcrR family transcriptional regulator